MKNLIITGLSVLLLVMLNVKIGNAQTTFGTNAGTQGGNSNSYYGQYSGANNTDSNNSFFGTNSGRYNVTGSLNSFFGTNSGLNNLDGVRNSFFGMDSGRDNTEGVYNTYVGAYSGRYNTLGERNSFFGVSSGINNIDGSHNSFIGTFAGYQNINGNYNSFLGYKSGRSNESGVNNTFLGTYAGFQNVIGINSTYIGYSAGRNATGNSNVFLGYQAGYHETGDNKLYIANSATVDPLIYGEFDSGKLIFNAQIGIASSTGISGIWNEQFSNDTITENFLALKANVNSGKPLFISETGRIAIGTDDICMKHTTIVDSTYLILEGNAVKTGSAQWHSTSDMNLKKNITPLQNSLNKFLNLNFYSYQYKKTNQTNYGIIAQEMEGIFPHSMGKLIEEDGTEYLTFNPNNLFYTGFKATQEIGELSLANEERIESIEMENDQLIELTNNLQKENADLKSELEAIKTALKNYGIEVAENTSQNSLEESKPHLLQNKPNPFNETTTLPYFLPENITEAHIIVYDVNGKAIKKLTLPIVEGYGNIELGLLKNDFAKGTYSYSLIVDGNLVDTKKMLTQ